MWAYYRDGKTFHASSLASQLLTWGSGVQHDGHLHEEHYLLQEGHQRPLGEEPNAFTQVMEY